ncbi:uncharacterized protein YcbK (DUF882 family) [Mesorhizobium sp. J18]|uniref:DUF882 domain-containing protein n=1 Tax=Mesorhizobium sp. J18 TaxID=935263 RepID=UPI00119973EE|nr:DUF882 domain-containing protein [Mesorhizobium sp. J18]TWH00149.1 uncharacterized protein YcbK (DUF882 family) [Mesorhizobium sp. J18]
MKSYDVPVREWRKPASVWSKYLAGLLLAITFIASSAVSASAETRTLKFYNLHTRERAEITYKRNGRYIQSGLTEINRFLRDWRRNEPTKMNPHLLDLVWEVYRQSGSRDYIHVICGYRAPATNAMLRKRSSGVANKSQHTLGNALDFYLPDVKLSKLRAIGLKMQAGGVGYYPSSGSPFVHMDVGNVRHWPRMSRSELLALFPDGKTMHVPTDGKPLPGYKQAVAAYEARKRSGSPVQIASGSGGSGRGLLASLFGGGADDEEDSAMVASAAPAEAAQARPARRTSAPQPAEPVRRAETPAAPVAAPEAVPETPAAMLAALSASDIPLPKAAPRPETEAPRPEVAVAAPAPDQVPFAIADAETLPKGPVDQNGVTLAALNVPIPTRRPDYTPEPTVEETLVAAASDEELLAKTADKPNASDAIAEVLKAEDNVMTASAASAFLPIPSMRPKPDVDEEITLAAIPGSRPAAIAAESAETKSREVAAAASLDIPSAPNSRQVGASQRTALLESDSATETSAIIAGSVKTTQKGARPDAKAARPDPKAVVLPVRAENARWAFNPEPVIQNGNGTKMPSFESPVVRAPSAVYTAGFHSGETAADASRFTGSAVTFLAVAKFNTN